MSQISKSKKYFEEIQGFDQLWLKLLMAGVALGTIVPMYYGTIKQIYYGVSYGNNPVSNTGLIIMDVIITVIILISVSFIFLLKLKTEIRSDGIVINFFPFAKNKLIKKEDILQWEVRKYKPIKEYGGWGYRFGKGKNGIAYNTKGNMGLQLVLKNYNKRILIGTQRPEAIKRAMKKLFTEERERE